jgi:hypothetical protein
LKKNENSVALTMAKALTLAAVLAVICATPVLAEKVEQEDSTGTEHSMFVNRVNGKSQLMIRRYMGTMTETAGFPQIYNIEADPKERVDVAANGGGWIMGPYMETVMKYKATSKNHPNPPASNVTKF